MFNFNPGEVPATKSSMEFVASMLAVLADPKGAATHLAEMQAKLDEIIQADAELRTKTSEADAATAATHQALDAREIDLAKREGALADIAATTAEADRRVAAAKDAEQKIATDTAAMIERETGVQQLERAAAQRNRELDTRSASLDARDAALSAQEADYQQRMSKLKALAGAQ